MAEVSLDKSGLTKVDVTGNKTLAAADGGIVQNVTVDGKVVTLPATAVGDVFIVRVADFGVGVQVAPNSADQIAGLGFTATDNKAAILASDNARAGDFLELVADGAAGWHVVRASGAWTRAA